MCHSHSLPLTACTVQERLKPRCARRVKAMCWGLRPIGRFIPGAKSCMWAVAPRRSHKAFPKRLGGVCRRVKVPKARLYDWAYLELADLDINDYNTSLTGLWTRG